MVSGRILKELILTTPNPIDPTSEEIVVSVQQQIARATEELTKRLGSPQLLVDRLETELNAIKSRYKDLL